MVAVVFVFGVAAPLASSALEGASGMGHEDCCHGSSHQSEKADAASKAAQDKTSGNEGCCEDGCAAGLSAACHCVSQQDVPLHNTHERRVVSGAVALVPVDYSGFHVADIQPRAPGQILAGYDQTLLKDSLPTYLRLGTLRL